MRFNKRCKEEKRQYKNGDLRRKGIQKNLAQKKCNTKKN